MLGGSSRLRNADCGKSRQTDLLVCLLFHSICLGCLVRCGSGRSSRGCCSDAGLGVPLPGHCVSHAVWTVGRRGVDGRAARRGRDTMRFPSMASYFTRRSRPRWAHAAGNPLPGGGIPQPGSCVLRPSWVPRLRCVDGFPRAFRTRRAFSCGGVAHGRLVVGGIPFTGGGVPRAAGNCERKTGAPGDRPAGTVPALGTVRIAAFPLWERKWRRKPFPGREPRERDRSQEGNIRLDELHPRPA